VDFTLTPANTIHIIAHRGLGLPAD